MRIAVPVTKGLLCLHFGHCEQIAIFEVDPDDKTVLGKQIHWPPPHEPGVLPRWLRGLGADVVIAGGMGARALDLFAESGMQVVTGAPSDKPELVVRDYLRGALQAGPNVCDH